MKKAPNCNKKNVRAWVAALRSGKYKQGQGCLRNAMAYCCLGVACDTFRKADGSGKWSHGAFLLEGNAYNNFLPKPVAKWLGINNSDPYLGMNRATVLNDRQKRTFDQIADAIEAEFLKPKASRKRRTP